MKKATITYENGSWHYWDKNGTELHAGDFIRGYYLGDVKLLETEDGQLGVDATNPVWVENGRAYEGEYGVYPLTGTDMFIEKVTE